MKNTQNLDFLKNNFSQSNALVENYLIRPEEEEYLEISKNALKEPSNKVIWPKISVNDYLSDADLKALHEINEKIKLRKFIDSRIPKSCKEPARTIFNELMYNVVKFSKNNLFNLKQTGALLSQFYLTHNIFTSSYNIAAEKLYIYFREIMLCHSVSSPPDSLKIFSMDESKNIMNFFCKIYLRNLPLIRIMCLPNFAFYVDTFMEQQEPLPMRKQTDKKKKGEKKDKKKKK